jgi:nucleoside-diphosphate-sugar epimerase
VRLLVLGGTHFLGRAVVDAALGQGHDVTLFNRGVTNPELYPGVERLRGDLESNLEALRGRRWDAAVDLDPTTLPAAVRRYAEVFADAVEHAVFVSTISVYADPSRPLTEASLVHEPPEPEPESFQEDLYGGLKVGCERAVRDVFGERAAIVRPGLIVGPNDPTERFTYWVRRLPEGGDVLAPGDPDRPVQLIDARDLGSWLVAVAARRISGVFNATGPVEPITLGVLLERMRKAIGPRARLVWVQDEPILAAGVTPWTELPLWLPGEDYTGLLRADIGRALREGLTLRPIEATARDTLAWSRTVPAQRPTLTRDRERHIVEMVELKNG